VTRRRRVDMSGSREETAAEYDLAVRRQYGYAATDAHRAVNWYDLAESYRNHARWLTARPHLWVEGPEGVNPARLEAAARTYVRLGDAFLGSYWRYVVQARQSADLARRYRSPLTCDNAE
jgi:hypothetical protein